MSDYDLPELPSDEELGLTDEDRETYGEDVVENGPELSAEERAALLGDEPAPRKAKKAKKQKREKREAAVVGEPEGPRSRWKGPLTLAALVAVSAVASSRTGQPSPVPANAPDTVFSSSRAMSVLVEIARRPRPVGSPEHARVRQLLVDRLRSLGLEPEIQTATALGQVPGAARAATVRNIVARLPGTAPTGAVLITAHYDSRELAPGAADDGAGLVTILEAMRALRVGEPPRNDVIILFTDAEEACLCGAQAFVERHPWMQDVSVVLSYEMRGAGGPSIMFETKDLNGRVVRALELVDPPPFANSMAYEVYRRMPNNTDFTEFREAGKQGLNFAALDRAHVYHQASDVPENLSESTLQHHGLSALALLRHFGGADLGTVDAANAVYFTVPVLGLVVYDAFWVLPVSGVLLLLAALAWFLVRAGGARAAGVLTGFGVAALGAALAFGIGLWLRTWIDGRYAEAGSLAGSVLYSEGWWVLAAVAATFAVVTTLHGLARRWLTAGELSLGALVLPLVLAVAASLTVPLGAMNVQLPLAAALVAVVALGLLRNTSEGAVGWLTTVALAVPVLLILVPVVELVWLAMTAQLIAVVAVLVALTLHLVLPALDALRHPNSWWAPATGVVVAAAALGMALLAARPSAERPAPSTLVYMYEHGTGSALWSTDPNADPALDAEAIAWAAERAGGSFSRTRDLSDFGYPEGPTPIADARRLDVPPPTVRVLGDTVVGPTRSVSLAVQSNVGAEVLRFQLDPALGTRILAINGASIEEPDSLRWAEHYGVPQEPGVILELRMPAAEPIGLHVVEHHLRPRELLGPAPFERPDALMPDVSAMSDRAAFRYSVAAYADPRHAFMPAPAAPDSAAAPQPSIERAAPSADSATAAPESAAPVEPPLDSTTATPDSAR